MSIYRMIRQFLREILNEYFLLYLIQGILICTVAMSLIAAAALLISRRLQRKQSASGRCLLWWIIGIGYLIPFKPHPAGAVATVVQYENRGLSPSFFPSEQFVLLFVIWLAGAVICTVRTVSRQAQFSRSITRLRRPADAPVQYLSALLCCELGITEHIPVYTVPVIQTPMLTGILHPCILLPEQEFDPAELRLILKHELCHYRRGDLFCKLLWIGCRVIHWFNPLMPLLMQQTEQDCELACDEAVMQNETAESANIYCRSILHAAMRRSGLHSDLTVATSFSGSKEMLKARLQAILSGGRKRRFLFIAAAAVILTAMTGSILAYAATDAAPAAPDMPEQTGTFVSSAPAPAWKAETYTVPQYEEVFMEHTVPMAAKSE